MFTRMSKIATLFTVTLIAPLSWGEWALDNDHSRLSFISIKATDVGEVHSFKQLSGSVLDNGQVNVVINLASVETLIPIRNERMQEFLFQTPLFPTASISTTIDPSTLNALSTSGVQNLTVAATLGLKDKTIPLSIEVLAAKLDNQTLVVSSVAPIILTAQTAGLAEGIEKLRELAGLPNISQAVPVSFVLTFRHEGK